MKPTLYKRLVEDIDSFMARDPAARSRWEVVLCYPGDHALIGFRASNGLWRHNWRLLARFLSNIAKIFTGIEIHPGATIGRRFFIDHGTGVVIGETSEIGDDVMLYQGVTLGGTSLEKGKRHPTLEDGVVVGSGAQVLGPLIVGAGARIGSNAVVLKDVSKGATMVGIPAKMVMARPKQPDPEFPAYGMTSAELPDPVARSFETMRAQINMLVERIEELEAERGSATGAASAKPDDDETEETKFKSAGG
jgi:serine O-acetyltransferase